VENSDYFLGLANYHQNAPKNYAREPNTTYCVLPTLLSHKPQDIVFVERIEHTFGSRGIENDFQFGGMIA